jgi:hypothetical protein
MGASAWQIASVRILVKISADKGQGLQCSVGSVLKLQTCIFTSEESYLCLRCRIGLKQGLSDPSVYFTHTLITFTKNLDTHKILKCNILE